MPRLTADENAARPKQQLSHLRRRRALLVLELSHLRARHAAHHRVDDASPRIPGGGTADPESQRRLISKQNGALEGARRLHSIS